MISDQTVIDVQRLLGEGSLSQRAIARETRISRESVRRIKLGLRTVAQPQGAVRRCPGCGGMVVLPCLRCAIRVRVGPDVFLASDLGVDLDNAENPGEYIPEGCRRRYEEVRANKDRARANGRPSAIASPGRAAVPVPSPLDSEPVYLTDYDPTGDMEP